ncbi:MAG: hypothetical protein C6D10_04020 [Candidatus Liberibacter solanacearum]
MSPYNKATCSEAVKIKEGLVEDGVVCVKQWCGKMEAREGIATEHNPSKKTRRYVQGFPKVTSSLVDKSYDQTTISVNILEGYARSAIKGMNRAQDHMIIKGIFDPNIVDDGTERKEKEFDPNMVVALNHGVETAPANSGTVLFQDKFNPKGLTWEKLLRAKTLIGESGGSDNINAIISHMDYENLLLDPRIKTVDYMKSGRVERGNITRIAKININIYVSEAIPGGLMAEYESDKELKKDRKDRKPYWTAAKMGAGVSRMIPVFSKDAVTLGIWKEIKKIVSVRTDLHNILQLFYSMKMGATRTNENHVAKILVSDS